MVTASAPAPKLILPVFVLAPAEELADELGLPGRPQCLFERLIGDPNAESGNPKERRCAEMVCCLLQSAEGIRNHLLRWLAGMNSSTDTRVLDELEFEFATEQFAIGRDDLRVVGRSRGQEGRPKLIWTVEVKLAARFHEGKVANETLHQLTKYDRWLDEQDAEQKAGWVLAIEDRSEDFPLGLRNPWRCVTWTNLGEQIAQAMRRPELGEREQFLGRHTLAFIREHFWRTSQMSKLKLDYNDISLIRAFAVLGDECGKKVDALVSPLVDVFRKKRLCGGVIKHEMRLFGRTGVSCVRQKLSAGSESYLCAGIGGESSAVPDFMSVWIETPQRHPKKKAFVDALGRMKGRLTKRNWTLPSQKSGDDAWCDLDLQVPLVTLLVAADQQRVVREFVDDALNDLISIGVIKAFSRTVGAAANRRGNVARA